MGSIMVKIANDFKKVVGISSVAVIMTAADK